MPTSYVRVTSYVTLPVHSVDLLVRGGIAGVHGGIRIPPLRLHCGTGAVLQGPGAGEPALHDRAGVYG